jgi:hypothetical protein
VIVEADTGSRLFSLSIFAFKQWSLSGFLVFVGSAIVELPNWKDIPSIDLRQNRQVRTNIVAQCLNCGESGGSVDLVLSSVPFRAVRLIKDVKLST